MVKTLIVFEFKDEIDAFISQKSIDELRKENVCVLALMPESQVYLKQLQTPFFNTCGFFCKEGHEHVLLQSDRICRFMESFLRIEDNLGVKEGYKNSFLYYTRLFVHYVLWLIEVIERCCKELCITKIMCFSKANRHITEPVLSITEGYLGEIGARIANKLNIEFESFINPKIVQNLVYKKFKKCAAEVVKYLIYQIKLRFLKFQIRHNKIILATSRSYNLGKVLDKFKQAFNNAYVIYLNNIYSNQRGSYLKKLLSAMFDEVIQLPKIGASNKKKFLETINDTILKIKDNKESNDVFAYRGITFSDLVLNKIKNDIIPVLCEIRSQTEHLDSFFKKYPPTIIISQMSRDINYNLGELASFYEIPSLLISHGSHIPPANEYEMIEWREHGRGLISTDYQFIALQSPWAKAHVEKIPVKSKQIVTGPLLFASIERNQNKKELLRKNIIRGHEDKIVLVHADTPRIRGDLRFYVYQTVDEYISSLNSLIKAVEDIKDMYLIIRFRPKYFLTKKNLINLLDKSDCYSICTEGTFEDYLSIADMLISYSSTTIEEALQNRVPVLLFDRDAKYCHIKNAQILDNSSKPERNSCYYVGKEETLTWAFQWLCENHFSKEVSVSLWNKHVFDDNEKVSLTAFFSNYFKSM